MEPFPFHYSRRFRVDDTVVASDAIPASTTAVASSSTTKPPVLTDTTLLIEEMRRIMAEEIQRLGDCIDGRCVGIDDSIDRVEQRTEERLISLEMGQAELEAGRASIEKKYDDVKLEVNRINRFLEREFMVESHGKPGILQARGPITERTPAGFSFDGGRGAREDDKFRTPGYGSHFHTQVSGHGMNNDPPPRHVQFASECDTSRGIFGDGTRTAHGRLPKVHFPQFTGENPQLWKCRCESYFEMYSVEQSMWVKVASMHFEGTAARWLQSAEKRFKTTSWDIFCSAIHDRFGRDQHESLIRQLFHIKQNGSVADYVEQILFSH